jgi:hypothetical protein
MNRRQLSARDDTGVVHGAASRRRERVGGAFKNHNPSSAPQPLNHALCSPEDAMSIQLTEEQAQAVAASGEAPTILADPKTQTDYVLIRKDLYESLAGEEYDDSPWTSSSARRPNPSLENSPFRASAAAVFLLIKLMARWCTVSL